MKVRPQELIALDDKDLELLPTSAREAIQVAIERIDRSGATLSSSRSH
jgi:hypothetical protein